VLNIRDKPYAENGKKLTIKNVKVCLIKKTIKKGKILKPKYPLQIGG